MPFQIEHEGKNLTVWTEEEVQAEVKGLKVTNENLKAEKQEAADKLRELKEQNRQLEEAKAKAEGDNEALQRIAEEREAEKRKAVEDERQRYADLFNMTKQEKINNYISSIVDEVKAADSVRARQLKKLMKVDFDFDFDMEKGEIKVRGQDVTNRDDLIRVLRESEDYQGYIAGSGATGGGSTGSNGAGVTKRFDELQGMERVALRRDNPAEYERLKRAAGK